MTLPNQLTILRIILTPVFLYLFLQEEPFLKQLALIIYVLAAITDWYDGWLARKFNYITNWGKFLDPLADKVLTSAAFFAFVLIDVLPLWMVMIIVIRDFSITLLRIYAEFRKKSFRTTYSAKVKTVMQMVFIYYLLTVFTFKTIENLYSENQQIFDILTNPEMITYVMFLITFFTFWTGVIYVFQNWNLIKRLLTIENKSV